MLEKLPGAIGHALRSVRPGLEKTVYASPDLAGVPETVRVTSEAFPDGGTIPEQYTDDDEGTSPPLAWSGLPAGTRAVAILVEDADSPTPAPLVHLIVADLPGRDGGVEAGAFDEDEGGSGTPRLGTNSFLGHEWLPPDPPPGHGPHRYLFQVYALNGPLGLTGAPGRGALLDAMRGRVLARGALVGTYERPDAG
jgi:Raf kinase inhibitor-like YbhB/YbcL family protein